MWYDSNFTKSWQRKVKDKTLRFLFNCVQPQMSKETWQLHAHYNPKWFGMCKYFVSPWRAAWSAYCFFLFAILYRLGPDQAYILEKKLECLYPEDKTVYTAKQDLRRANKRNSQLKILRSKLFQCIWEQSEYGEHDIGWHVFH